MKIIGVIWLRSVVDKLASKHRVAPEEVEEVLGGRPTIRRIERGNIRGEDVYAALGRSHQGRYLAVFFVDKAGEALIISARDMTRNERRTYGKKASRS